MSSRAWRVSSAQKAVQEKRAVARLRAQVFALIGGACAECGATENIEPDHIAGRDWSPRALGWRTRWRRYLDDARAGLLRPLCRAHNRRDGRERMLAAREAREREEAAAFAKYRRESR